MAYEVKVQDRQTGFRQLVYYICTALHHRIALGVDTAGDKNAVYGLLQVGSSLQLYVGTFQPEGDKESDSFQPQRIVCLIRRCSLMTILIMHGQTVRPTGLEWDLKTPGGLIRAYFELLDVAKMCHANFCELWKDTQSKRDKMIRLRRCAHIWRGPCDACEAEYSDDSNGVADTHEEVEEEDDDDEELEQQAGPLIVELSKGARFDNAPLEAANVCAAHTFRFLQDEALQKEGKYFDPVASWLGSIEAKSFKEGQVGASRPASLSTASMGKEECPTDKVLHEERRRGQDVEQ